MAFPGTERLNREGLKLTACFYPKAFTTEKAKDTGVCFKMPKRATAKTPMNKIFKEKIEIKFNGQIGC